MITLLIKYCVKQRIESVYEQVGHYLCVLFPVQKMRQYLSDMPLILFNIQVVWQNVTGLQWMASEAWIASAVLQTPDIMPYLAGTLGIAIRRGEIPGFREFLLKTCPDQHHNNSYRNSMVRV